jgi:tRNA A-37 threonylcarbamoyl transferase component Bud32
MGTGAGSVIGGRFRLAEQVGQGGMGRVWRGHDEFLDRDVAVKEVLLPERISDDERAGLVARTTREARSAARLNHPGVVTIHDVVRHDGEPWIVMEYVPGLSLAARIARDGRLPGEEVARVGAKIADALAHAHAAGIVHRDLKPDNILLSGDRVVVTDFGIARIIDDTGKLTLTGTVLGTPHYMSPEQLEGRQVDAPADVWSLGATLYTALEGHPPFAGPTLTAVIAAILAREPAPALQAGSLGGLLTQMLAKDPARRPTATAVAQALSGTHPVTVTVSVPAVASPTSAGRVAPAAVTVRQAPADGGTGGQVAPPPTAPWRGRAPGSGSPAPSAPVRASPVRAATAGLWLTIIAGLAGIIDANLSPYPNPADSTAFGDAGYLIAIAAAVAALASARHRQPLSYFVLGSWAIALSWVSFDVLGVPDFHVFSGSGHYIGYYLLAMASDLGGLVAVGLLLAALGRFAERRSWRPSLSLPAVLFGALVAGEVVWRLQELTGLIGPEYFRNSFTYPSSYYAYSVSSVVAIGTVAAVAWYGLTLRDRLLGGALLAGWAVSETFTFFGYLTGGWYFRHRTVADNVLSAALLIGSVILALAYTRRRQLP